MHIFRFLMFTSTLTATLVASGLSQPELPPAVAYRVPAQEPTPADLFDDDCQPEEAGGKIEPKPDPEFREIIPLTLDEFKDLQDKLKKQLEVETVSVEKPEPAKSEPHRCSKYCSCEPGKCDCQYPLHCYFKHYDALGYPVDVITIQRQDGDATVTDTFRRPLGRSLSLKMVGGKWAAWGFANGPVTPANGMATGAILQNANSKLVIDAGRDAGVLSITTGSPSAVLQAAAEYHAAEQARLNQQGHQNWGSRRGPLAAALPGYEIEEIAAESWPWQQAPEQAAPEMFKSWRQSSGHWAIANYRGGLYGYSMARGSNGIWYGCGVCARKLQSAATSQTYSSGSCGPGGCSSGRCGGFRGGGIW